LDSTSSDLFCGWQTRFILSDGGIFSTHSYKLFRTTCIADGIHNTTTKASPNGLALIITILINKFWKRNHILKEFQSMGANSMS